MEYSCNELSKNYHNFKSKKPRIGIEDASIVFNKGDIVGLVGLTQSGKSCLMELLTGKRPPNKGKLSYNPKEVTKLYYQDSVKLNKNLTVYDNMVVFGKKEKMSELDVESRMAQLRDIFDLQKYINTKAGELSDANRVKAELAMVLINTPRMLFVDDAFNFLSNVDRIEVLKCLKRLNKQERTIIVISAHSVSDVDKIINRIILIDKSRVIYDNDASAFKEKYCKNKIFEVSLNKNVSINKLEDVTVLESSDYYYKLLFLNREGMFSQIINLFDVNNIIDLKVSDEPLIDLIKLVEKEEDKDDKDRTW